MAKQKIDSFLGGVSQLPPWERLPSQAESSVNAFANIVKGLQKRPPTDHVAKLTATTAGYADAGSPTQNEMYPASELNPLVTDRMTSMNPVMLS